MQLLLDEPELGVCVGVTERSDGDVHPTRVPEPELARRQTRLTGRRWAMAAQVHGTDVWEADEVRSADRLVSADIVVLRRPHTPEAPSALAMWAADCATVVFATSDALIGVHAGWRGLAAGAVQQAAGLAEACAGTQGIAAVAIGPVIGPCCYEFGESDLGAVAAGVGTPADELRGVSSAGTPALDVSAALRAALASGPVSAAVSTVVSAAEGCTGCSDHWFSHRARADVERHALVGWFR